MTEPKLQRYLALDRLERGGQTTEPGQWCRLEPETGTILGLSRAVPEAALKADPPDPAVLAAIVRSRACFAPGALAEARARGIMPAAAVALALAHAAELAKRRGGAAALVGGVTVSDLMGWAAK